MGLFTFMNTWLWDEAGTTRFKRSIQGMLSKHLFNSDLSYTTTDPLEKQITQDTEAISN